ncbi:MAG: ABC transporter permease [Thermomicrobiales bacterium]|nr:ABC transporter permease [Thermomicrobiales bacterium]MCO5222844.1 ABC transporter permease [Thermomicrobiales bacterium]
MTAKQRRFAEIVLTIASPILLLLIWELISRSGRIDQRFWPAPSSLWDTTRTMVQDEDLFGEIWLTLERILAGFAMGAVPGIIIGLLMGISWPIRAFLMPIATAIYAIPKIALLPLVLIALGTGEMARWVIVALSIFFVVALSTMGGVLALDPIFTDVARNFGGNRWTLFRTVALPGSTPAIFTGLRLALGFALIVVVGTEFVRPNGGVGSLIWESYSILSIKKMYVGLIVTALMGWLLVLGLDLIERLVVPWRRAL